MEHFIKHVAPVFQSTRGLRAPEKNNCSKLNLGLRPSDPKRFGPIRRDNESANEYFNIEDRTSNDEIASFHLFIDNIFCLSFLSKIGATYFKNDRIPYSKFDPPEADKCLLASGELDVRCSTFKKLYSVTGR